MSKVCTQSNFKKALPFIVCFLAALFYLYEYALRVAPSAMMQQLMASFHTDSTGFGMLASLFFYGYASMQIPAGLLLDRFGARKLLIVSVLICSFSTLIFAYTTSLMLAGVTRVAIGVAAAFAFPGTLLLASRWFSSRRFVMIAGIVQLLGCMGAICGEHPMAILVGHLGWRMTLVYSASVGVLLFVLYCLLLQDSPKKARFYTVKQIRKSELGRLSLVIKHRQMWMIALYAFGIWAPITLFGSVWGISFLKVDFHLSVTRSASMVAFLWIGVAFASPLVGWWSDYIGQRRLPLQLAAGLSLLSTLAIVYLPHLSMYQMVLLLFLLGVSSCGQMICFGLVKDIMLPRTHGTAFGFNNMAVVAGGVLLSPLVGFLLNQHWSGQRIGNAPIYAVSDYHFALVILPLSALLTVVMSLFFIKETNCVAQYPQP